MAFNLHGENLVGFSCEFFSTSKYLLGGQRGCTAHTGWHWVALIPGWLQHLTLFGSFIENLALTTSCCAISQRGGWWRIHVEELGGRGGRRRDILQKEAHVKGHVKIRNMKMRKYERRKKKNKERRGELSCKKLEHVNCRVTGSWWWARGSPCVHKLSKNIQYSK